MSGLPLLNGSASKEPSGTRQMQHTALVRLSSGSASLQILGSILTFIYLIHAFYVIFMGKPKEDFAKVKEAPLYMLVPIVIIATLHRHRPVPGLRRGHLRFAADALLHMGA